MTEHKFIQILTAKRYPSDVIKQVVAEKARGGSIDFLLGMDAAKQKVDAVGGLSVQSIGHTTSRSLEGSVRRRRQ